MAFNNKIFQVGKIKPYSMSSRDRYNRAHLYSSATYNDMNTYMNFGIFPTLNDQGGQKWDDDGFLTDDGMKEMPAGGTGVRSIFSKQSAVFTGDWGPDAGFTEKIPDKDKQKAAVDRLVKKASQYRKYQNAPLMDAPEVKKQLRELGACSVRDLVKASKTRGVLGRAGYSYSDFMYCKHLGKVPNNYMITVRRFAMPVPDSILSRGTGSSRSNKANAGATTAPIGTMVTWMGVSGNEMQNILKYSYKMSFEEKTAEWHDPQKIGGGDGGMLNAMEAMINPATRRAAAAGNGVPAMEGVYGFFGGKQGPYDQSVTLNYKHDKNHIFPEQVDNVTKIYTRGMQGLTFDWKFSLVFEYELRAYNGINPKQAMLDLLSNILSVTYTKGGFWGGGYNAVANPQMSAFQNLNIFKAHGTFTEYMDAFVKDAQGVKDKVSSFIDTSGGIIEAAKKVLNVLGGMLIGGLINSMGRPAKYAYPSLLQDVPVGFWHITIGNPKRPIVSAGNMILTNTTIEQSGPLGLDDFPTNLKVTMEFDRGRPKDKAGIEKMYMRGDDRIALSMTDAIFNMYQAASVYKGKSSVNSQPAATTGENIDSKIAAVENNATTKSETDPTTTQMTEAEENARSSEIAALNAKMRSGEIDEDTYHASMSNVESKYQSLQTRESNENQESAKNGNVPDAAKDAVDKAATMTSEDLSVVEKSKEILIEYFSTDDVTAILMPAQEMVQGSQNSTDEEKATAAQAEEDARTLIKGDKTQVEAVQKRWAAERSGGNNNGGDNSDG